MATQFEVRDGVRFSYSVRLPAVFYLLLGSVGLVYPSHGGTFAGTQLCWEDPATTSSTQGINPAAFVDCTHTGSANVTTPGASGNQIFVGSASAIASPSIWRVALDASVTNYMRDMYQYSTTSTTNQIWASPAAAFAGLSDTDTVTAGGGPGVFSLSYIFSVDGTLSSSGAFSSRFCASLSLPQGVGTVTSFCRSPGQTIPSSFTLTYSQLPFGGPITPTLNIVASGTIIPIFPNQVGTSADTIINGSASVHFGSTVSLTSILVTDSNGNPIPDVTFASQGGFNFPLAPANQVPEPAWFSPLGLAALVLLRRRRVGLITR